MNAARMLTATTLVLLTGLVSLADKKSIENPEFTQWSKYKPDTMTKLKMTSEIAGMKNESVIVTTLKEVGADKLVLEVETTSKINGMEFKAPPTKRDVAKMVEIEATPGDAPKVAKPAGTTEEGTETLKIGESEVKTKWYKYKTKANDLEVEGQSWISEDVPGSLVKMVTKTATFSSTMELIEFVKK